VAFYRHRIRVSLEGYSDPWQSASVVLRSNALNVLAVARRPDVSGFNPVHQIPDPALRKVS